MALRMCNVRNAVCLAANIIRTQITMRILELNRLQGIGIIGIMIF